MEQLSPMLQTLFADLVQQVSSAQEKPGSVYEQTVKGAKYLYARHPVGAVRRDVYLGPASDPKVQEQAELIRLAQREAKARRQLVRSLRDNGVPIPTRALGTVLDVMSDAGLFNDAVLVGTAAYMCYSPIIGMALPAATLMTQDADLATASLAISGDAGSASMLDILRRADETFSDVPGLSKTAPPSAFRSQQGFLVDLLTPQRRRTDRNPMPLDNLKAGATPLQHLDWLIEAPVKTVALYGAGIAVRIPQPARYAVHKLILAQKRGPSERLKRGKDLLQAKALYEALGITDPHALHDAMEDAAAKGIRGWKQPMLRSLKELRLDAEAAT